MWPPGVNASSKGTILARAVDGNVTVEFENGSLQEYNVSELQKYEDPVDDATASTTAASPCLAVDKPGSTGSSTPRDTCDEPLCPITKMAIQDPVCAADGETYERAAFDTYCAKLRDEGKPLVSPMTMVALDTDRVYANRALIRMR